MKSNLIIFEQVTLLTRNELIKQLDDYDGPGASLGLQSTLGRISLSNYAIEMIDNGKQHDNTIYGFLLDWNETSAKDHFMFP